MLMLEIKRTAETMCIETSILEARDLQRNLILVTGKNTTGLINELLKGHNAKVININSKVVGRLSMLSKVDRSKSVLSIFKKIIREEPAEIKVLTNIEILFDSSLAVDPLRLLQSVDKNHLFIVIWPGKKEASRLSYATPSHPEYRSYKSSDFSNIIFIEADKNNNQEET